MQHLFVGLTKSDMAAVKQFKLKALALLLVYVVKATNQSARALCHQFLSQVDEINKYLFLINEFYDSIFEQCSNYFTDFLNRYLIEEDVSPEPFTSAVVKELSMLEEAKPGSVSKVLVPHLENSKPTSPPKLNMHVSFLCINI